MRTPSPFPRLQRGVSLVELLVALVIGLFLMLGAVYVYNHSRNSYRTSEVMSRLQESGRLALDVIEADLRMANFWGMSNRSEYILNRAGAGLPTPAGFNATQSGNLSRCGAAGSFWMITLEEYLGGTNNSYGLATCAALNYLAGTDVVFLRRASETAPIELDPDQVYLQTSRLQGTLFVPDGACTDPENAACIPADYQPPRSASRELEAHVYYVSSQSALRDDVPALRRKRLANINAATEAEALLDEELVPGVEDLQVRFGVDTNGDSNVDQYVNPNAVPAGATVISATIWLRVRAEDREIGFIDGTSYQYADMAAAVTPSDNFRRIVVSKTIYLRNSRV
jgi:type IV pilus assembly protein PilW